jgi:hypothetical protein
LHILSLQQNRDKGQNSFCLVARGLGGEGGSWGKGRGGEKGGEMTQTLYAHMNKRNKKIVNIHTKYQHTQFNTINTTEHK